MTTLIIFYKDIIKMYKLVALCVLALAGTVSAGKSHSFAEMMLKGSRNDNHQVCALSEIKSLAKGKTVGDKFTYRDTNGEKMECHTKENGFSCQFLNAHKNELSSLRYDR